MGADIYADSGVLFTIDEAVNKFFKGLNKKSIADIIESCNSIITDENELHFLKNIANTDDLKSWFISFAQKLVDDEGQLDSDILSVIFYRVIDKTKFTDLPIARFEYFTSNRYSGYDVPTNTICLILDDAGLFETKMTTEGKLIAKLMGLKKIEKTTWTVYSC